MKITIIKSFILISSDQNTFFPVCNVFIWTCGKRKTRFSFHSSLIAKLWNHTIKQSQLSLGSLSLLQSSCGPLDCFFEKYSAFLDNGWWIFKLFNQTLISTSSQFMISQRYHKLGYLCGTCCVFIFIMLCFPLMFASVVGI